MFLVPVDVNHESLDLEEPIVARNAKLESDFITFRGQSVRFHVDSRDRQIYQESGFLPSIDGESAAADERDSK